MGRISSEKLWCGSDEFIAEVGEVEGDVVPFISPGPRLSCIGLTEECEYVLAGVSGGIVFDFPEDGFQDFYVFDSIVTQV